MPLWSDDYNEYQRIGNLFKEIRRNLQNIPEKKREFLFSGSITENDFITQIVWQFYKWCRIESSEKGAYRRFVMDPEGENESYYKQSIYNLNLLIKRNQADLERLNLPESEYTKRLQNKERDKFGNFPAMKASKYDKMAADNSSRSTGLLAIEYFKNGAISSSKRCSKEMINNAYHDLCKLIRECSIMGPKST